MQYAAAFRSLGYRLASPRQDWSAFSGDGVCISLWSKELRVRNNVSWLDTAAHARPLVEWGSKPGNQLRIAHLMVARTRFDGFVDVVLVSGTPGDSYEKAEPWDVEKRGGQWRVTALDEVTGHFVAEVVPSTVSAAERPTH
jgi:hypothetical protein